MAPLDEALADAQARAEALFREVDRLGIVRPGETEESINEAIFALGAARFGTRKHWHRRVVRAGINTRRHFYEACEDRRVDDDDIVWVDLGPVFGEYEADFGRTFVVGADPAKVRLKDDLEVVFRASASAYFAQPSMTGAELHAQVVEAAAARGWGFGGTHAGHLVGQVGMKREERDAARNRIRSDNQVPMNAPGDDGLPRHWILEVHLLDPTGAFGGFFEERLRPPASPSGERR